VGEVLIVKICFVSVIKADAAILIFNLSFFFLVQKHNPHLFKKKHVRSVSSVETKDGVRMDARKETY